jgi:hypothetical protein
MVRAAQQIGMHDACYMQSSTFLDFVQEDSPQNSQKCKSTLGKEEVRSQKSEVRMNAEGFYSVF